MPKTGFCDTYNTFGGPTEEDYKCAQDMGLNAQNVENITMGWRQSMSLAQNAIVANNGFNWQLFRSVDGSPNSTECTSWIRGTGSTFNNSALLYVYTQTENMSQQQFEIDLAIFLLIRGPYAWLGYQCM